VTPSDNVTDVNDVASRNAATPIDVTDAGIVTDVTDVAAKNAQSAILVTPDGITTAPAQSEPLDPTRTSAAISYVGLEPLVVPVAQLYCPSGSAAAAAGLSTRPTKASEEMHTTIETQSYPTLNFTVSMYTEPVHFAVAYDRVMFRTRSRRNSI
jgi:hypothetical protein